MKPRSLLDAQPFQSKKKIDPSHVEILSRPWLAERTIQYLYIGEINLSKIFVQKNGGKGSYWRLRSFLLFCSL